MMQNFLMNFSLGKEKSTRNSKVLEHQNFARISHFCEISGMYFSFFFVYRFSSGFNLIFCSLSVLEIIIFHSKLSFKNYAPNKTSNFPILSSNRDSNPSTATEAPFACDHNSKHKTSLVYNETEWSFLRAFR